MSESARPTTKISKTFNAESYLRAINEATENMIKALQSSDKGIVRTWISAGINSIKLTSAAKNLAHILDVSTENKRTYTLLNELAAKASEQQIVGADRLKSLIDWNNTFWAIPEVKAADALTWQPIKSTQIIKQFAQQQPQP